MSIIKGTNQIVAGFGGTKRSIGEVYFSQSALATDNSGALPLFTGETIASANTIYPEFYNWVLVHTELQCTSAEYESALTTYGECAKYVIGGGSLRLPLIKNYIKAANPSEGIKNIEAGLPNITGKTGRFAGRYEDGTGALRTVDYGQSSGTRDEQWNSSRITFDASLSNPIYGKSSTVIPASTTLYPWVVAYTSAIPASVAQAAEFQQGLSGKADTNLGNLSTAGKDLASGLGMPSNRYINLTLGASGSTYTAPANGWYCLKKQANGNGQSLSLQTSKIQVDGNATVNGNYVGLILPVVKGDVLTVYYTLGGNIVDFRFIYAEGAE